MSDGTCANLLFPGTRVRHVDYPKLTGTIRKWEMHESGKPSPIPYNIDWDDDRLAREMLGMFYFYSSPERVVIER